LLETWGGEGLTKTSGAIQDLGGSYSMSMNTDLLAAISPEKRKTPLRTERVTTSLELKSHLFQHESGSVNFVNDLNKND